MSLSRKRIGTEAVRAQFGFVCVDPHKLTERDLYSLLGSIFRMEQGLVAERVVTRFVAYVEAANAAQRSQSRDVSKQFLVDGFIHRVLREDVVSVLEEKKFHASAAFRKAGNKSTHPPRFLTEGTLVIVAGSRRFLMDNLDLYLEQEGLMRNDTFSLLKDIAELEYSVDGTEENYLHIDVAHRQWYRGNVEALEALMRRNGMTVMRTHELLQTLTED